MLNVKSVGQASVKQIEITKFQIRMYPMNLI